MMVIQGTVDGQTRVCPLDRCVYSQVDDTRGYSITNAIFFPGVNANFPTSVGGSGTDSGEYVITNAVLGYIGKSGRFVAISN